MITPELIGYIRGEFEKGRTREEVHTGLVADGGWSEVDLNEAFRTVIPMQSSTSPDTATQNTQSIQNNITAPVVKDKIKLSRKVLENLIFIIIAIACVLSWYFYRPQIINFWNSGVKSSQEFSVSSWNSLEDFSVNSWNLLEDFSSNSWNSLASNFKKISLPSFKFPSFSFSNIFGNKNKQASDDLAVSQDNTISTPEVKALAKNTEVKDCGTTTAPDLKNKNTYENDSVLNCLGNGAMRCENTRAVLKDNLFPTIFQIIQNKNQDQNTGQQNCNFKLSYGEDSTLIDKTGKKLAGQYISCPISVVKAIDDTNPTSPKFIPIQSGKTNLSKYASQIYFYGTLGIFMESSVDKNTIQDMGCSGPFIDSVIASYKMQNN